VPREVLLQLQLDGAHAAPWPCSVWPPCLPPGRPRRRRGPTVYHRTRAALAETVARTDTGERLVRSAPNGGVTTGNNTNFYGVNVDLGVSFH